MAWDLNKVTRNNNPHLKKAWGIYTPQRRKLVVGPCAAPVRPVFENLAVGASGTGPVKPVRPETPRKPFL
jgi:hypothetical protein